MSARKILDRESFENFLANAVAVQQSGLDTRSVCALLEIEQFIASGEFSLDRGMQMIADRGLALLNASGTAIALLDSNELVYRVGAGSAANEIGRRVTAALNGPSNDVRREILRVENAETDKRIEADICRQFGAISLLILPICERHILVGVLEVRYDCAHSFTSQEIRICRLMIGALEEGIVQHRRRTEDRETVGAVEQAHGKQVWADRGLQRAERVVDAMSISADVTGQNVAQGQNVTNKKPLVLHRALVIREIGFLWTRLRMAIRSTANTNWGTNYWRVGAVVCAAALLGIFVRVSNITHPSATTKGLFVSTQLSAGKPAPGKRLAANDRSYPSISGHHESTKLGRGFRRIQIGPHEVDYIAEDVTIRRFTISRAKRHRSIVREVHFGDDVTVRYFVDAGRRDATAK